MSKKLPESFCLAPFISLSTKPSGELRPCCRIKSEGYYRDSDGELFNLSKNSFQEVWNSEHAKKLRVAFLKGEKPKECSSCFDLEAVGKKSHRVQAYESLNYGTSDNTELREKLAKYMDKMDGHIDFSPLDLDLRLGNICNARCRSCSSFLSHPLYMERKSLIKESDREAWDPEIKKWMEEDVEDHQSRGGNDWGTEIPIDLDMLSPDLRRMSFYGGEPTLIKQVEKLILKAIEDDRAKDINLKIVTNGSEFNEKWTGYLEHFKSSLIIFSIDGVGKDGEYLRHPLKWKRIEANLKSFLETKGFRLGKDRVSINFTAQLSNMLSFKSLFSWYSELEKEFGQSMTFSKQCRLNWNPLEIPNFLSFGVAPKSLRELAVAELRSCKDYETYGINDWEGLAKYIEQVIPIEHLLPQFVSYTRILDKKRNESFEDTFPRLAEFVF